VLAIIHRSPFMTGVRFIYRLPGEGQNGGMIVGSVRLYCGHVNDTRNHS
jgi:hypothetical protein